MAINNKIKNIITIIFKSQTMLSIILIYLYLNSYIKAPILKNKDIYNIITTINRTILDLHILV